MARPRPGAVSSRRNDRRGSVHDTDGTRWILFKRMGTGGGIYVMRFSERRLRAFGHAQELIAPDAAWTAG
jgi:hypothetical protein